MENNKKGIGIGVAAMVCGIVGLVLICTPVGGILCIIGLLLAILAMIRNCTGMAVAGLVTSLIGTIIFALAVLGISYIDSIFNRPKEETTQPETTIQEDNQDTGSTPLPTSSPAPNKKNTKKEKYKSYADKIKVKVYNKKNLPIDYNVRRYIEFIELDYKVINKSPKAIKGIKGTLNVYNQFEELIISINWNISDTIKSNKTKAFTNQGIDYNQFLDSHQKLYNEKFENLIFKYEASQINFSDGYKLKL